MCSNINLIFTIHHIISDGWSLSIIKKKIVELYLREEKSLNKNELQFKDYSFWLNSQLSQNNFNSQKNYWTSKFENKNLRVELPKLKFAKNTITKGNVVNFYFNQNLSNLIEQFNIDYNYTKFNILLGGVSSLLYRYTNQNNITVAIPHANRSNVQFENIIGPFINTILVNSEFNYKTTFNKTLSALISTRKLCVTKPPPCG